jgi:hypothetical protein
VARTAECLVPRTWINEYDQSFLTRPLAAQRHSRRGPAAQSLRSLYASKKTLAPVNAARAALGGRTDSDQRALDAASARDVGRSLFSTRFHPDCGCSHNLLSPLHLMPLQPGGSESVYCNRLLL